MNKLKKVVIVLIGLLILSACGNTSNKASTKTPSKSAKLSSTTYTLKGMAGITSTITLEYDKDNNIQKTTTNSIINISESDQTKEIIEQTIATSKMIYKDMVGVKHMTNLTDDKMTEKLVVNVGDLEESSFSILFATAAKENKIALADYSAALESVGFDKK